MSAVFFFLFHIHTFAKFAFTNWRYNKYGYRRFKFRLFQELPKNQGGGYKKVQVIKIKVDYFDGKMGMIPVPEDIQGASAVIEYRENQLPFIILRDEHKDVFQKCDHMTHKEII